MQKGEIEKTIRHASERQLDIYAWYFYWKKLVGQIL